MSRMDERAYKKRRAELLAEISFAEDEVGDAERRLEDLRDELEELDEENVEAERRKTAADLAAWNRMAAATWQKGEGAGS